jgi:ribonuclease P protein component
MLPRHQRLRKDREFQRVRRQGRSWAHPLLALHVLPAPQGQRVGISVSKKVGKAVQRNRVRRRLREIVRGELPAWRNGFDAILVARPAAEPAQFSQLVEVIRELARRARLAREPGEPSDTLYRMPAGRTGSRTGAGAGSV